MIIQTCNFVKLKFNCLFIESKVIWMDMLHTIEGFGPTREYLENQGYMHLIGTSEPVVFVKNSYCDLLNCSPVADMNSIPLWPK